MKLKSLLLGLVEGVVITLIVLFTLRFRDRAPIDMDLEISPDLSIVLLLGLTFSAALLISNNVRKLVFAETAVPPSERAIEVMGGVAAIAVAISLFLAFAQ